MVSLISCNIDVPFWNHGDISTVVDREADNWGVLEGIGLQLLISFNAVACINEDMIYIYLAVCHVKFNMVGYYLDAFKNLVETFVNAFYLQFDVYYHR